MGLDMYLNAKRSLFVSAWSPDLLAQEVNAVVRKHLEKEGSSFPVGQVNANVGGSIEIAAIYWRKANAIHGWFVNNVQDGKDDCGEYIVSREQLEELRDLCRQVIIGDDDGGAREKLQPVEGFFFGPTDDDEWYLEYVKDTADEIDRALTLPRDWDFYYSSSW